MQYVKELDIRYRVDLVVVGGGPAGVAAAWSAARNGSRVLLLESAGALGGMGTIGGVPMFTCFINGVDFLAGGFGKELFDRCFAADAVAPEDGENHRYKRGSISIQAEKLKKIYDEMVLESGAEVLFYTRVVDAVCQS
ncbi:MAG: FAD-dependent oxidoreductase, partial [Clostridia bacterium]|nr:FAD-dependent oxidoreductase [Clostridia bacterium]